MTRYSFLFWGVRADALILFCLISSSILLLRSQRRLWPLLMVGLLTGVGINLKLYAFIYFIPLYFYMYQRFGLKALISTIPVIAGAAYIPFLVPQISLHYFLLGMSSFSGNFSHPVELIWIVLINLVTFLFFLMPILLIVDIKKLVHSEKLGLSILIVSTGLMAIIACQASQILTYYLIPVLPVYFLIFSGYFRPNNEIVSVRNTWRWWIPYLATLFLFVSIGDLKVAKFVLENNSSIIKDLNSVLTLYPKVPLSMGYSTTFPTFNRNDYLTYYQNFLLFNGQPLLISGTTILDNVLIALHQNVPIMPDATVAAIKNGAVKVWLFPRGSTPGFFNSFSYKREFLRHYKHVSDSRFYSLWEYNQKLDQK